MQERVKTKERGNWRWGRKGIGRSNSLSWSRNPNLLLLLSEEGFASQNSKRE